MNLRFPCVGYIGWFYLRAMKYIAKMHQGIYFFCLLFELVIFHVLKPWCRLSTNYFSVLCTYRNLRCGTIQNVSFQHRLLPILDWCYLPSLYFSNFVVCFCCAGIPTFSGNTYPHWCNFTFPEDHVFFNCFVLHWFTTVGWYADSRLAIPVSPQNS